MIQKLNSKMVDYLYEQINNQEEAEGKLMYALACSDKELPSAAKLSAMFYEVVKCNRYIRHALRESNECDMCQENGLVDTTD